MEERCDKERGGVEEQEEGVRDRGGVRKWHSGVAFFAAKPPLPLSPQHTTAREGHQSDQSQRDHGLRRR